jgi:hypothetical protein
MKVPEGRLFDTICLRFSRVCVLAQPLPPPIERGFAHSAQSKHFFEGKLATLPLRHVFLEVIRQWSRRATKVNTLCLSNGNALGVTTRAKRE